MSKEVDQKIVEMQFDNKQFEKGVATTMTTLDRFNKALEFKDSSKGFTNIQNGIDSVKFDRLLAGVETISQRFTTAGMIGQTIIRDITSSALSAISNIGHKVTGMVKTGGINRALNIEQAKFQLKGLGVAWDDIKDDIDYGVKDTAYGLDAAAKVASQLVASQVSLGDEMKAALRGVSGVAAMTSSSYEEIGHIFTTVAGNGRLMTEQLQQFSYRGLNAAATLAKALGVTEAEIREMVTKGQIDFKTFATAMDSAFGEHAKDANSIFTGVMSNVKAALSRVGANVATPALERLTKVFNNLIPVINNFNKTLEPLYAVLGSLMDVLADKISRVLDVINMAIGPAYKVLEKVVTKYTQNMVDSLTGLETWLTKTFNLDPLVEASDVGKKAIESLTNAADDASKKNTDAITAGIGIITEQEAKAAWDIWQKGLYGVGEERRKNIEAEGMSYEHVQGYINALIDANFDLEKVQIQVGDSGTTAMDGVKDSVDKTTDSVDKQVKKTSPLLDFFRTVKSIGDVVFNVFRNVITVVKSVTAAFNQVFPFFSSDVSDVADKLKKLSERLLISGETADKLRRIFKGVFSVIDILLTPIKALGNGLSKLFKPLTDDMEAFNGGILETLASFGDWLYDLDQAIKKGELAETAFGKLISMFQNLPETLKKVKDTFLKYVNEAIDAVEDWSGIDIRGKFSSMIDSMKDVGKNLVSGFTSGMKAFIAHPFQTIKEVATAIIDKFKEVLGIHSPSKETEEMGKNLILGLWEGLKKNVGIIIKKIPEITSDILATIASGFNTIVEAIDNSGIPTSLSNLASAIWKVLTALFADFTDAGAKAISAILDGIASAFDNFADWLNSGGLKKAWNNAKSTFADIRKNLFGDDSKKKSSKKKSNAKKDANVMSTIASDLTKQLGAAEESSDGLGSSLANVFGSIGDFVTENPVQALGMVEIAAFTKAISGFSSAAEGIGKGFEKFFGSLGDAIEGFNKKVKIDIVRTIAKSVVMLAGAIVVVAAMDPKAAWSSAGIISALFLEIIKGVQFVQENLVAGLKMGNIVRMVEGLAIGIDLLAVAMTGMIKAVSKAVSAGQGKSVIAAFIIISGFLGEMAYIMVWLTDTMANADNVKISGVAATFLAMGTAITGLVAAMIPLTFMPVDNLLKGAAAIAVIGLILEKVMEEFVKMSATYGTDAKTILAAGAAMDLITAAILGLIPPIVVLGLLPLKDLAQGEIAVAILEGLFGAMIYLFGKTKDLSPKSILSAGATIDMISGAILTLMVPITALGKMKLGDITQGLIAVAVSLVGLVAAIKYLSDGSTTNGKDMVLIGMAMGTMAKALNLLTKPIKVLSKISWPKLLKAGIALGVLAAGIVLMAKWAPSMEALSLAFIGFSAAAFIFAAAIAMIAKAGAIFAGTLIALAASWDTIKGKMESAAEALGTFIRELCDQIVESRVELTMALTTLFRVLLDSIVALLTSGKLEWIPVLVEIFATFIEELLEALEKHAPKIIKSLVHIIVEVINGVVEELGKGVVDLASTMLNFIVDLLHEIANGAQGIIDGLFAILSAVVTGFLAGADQLIVDVITWATGLPGLILAAIMEGFGIVDTGKDATKLREIGENVTGSLIGGIGSLFTDLWNKAAEIPLKIWNGIKSAWSYISDVGENIMTSIGTGIEDFMDTPLGAISDMIDAIEEKIDEMVEWVGDRIAGVIHDMDFLDVVDWDDPVEVKSREEIREMMGWDDPEKEGYTVGWSYGEGLIGGAGDAMEIGSPSKATERFGKYLNQGLAIGMKKSSPAVFNQVDHNIKIMENGVMAVVRKTQQIQRSGLLDTQPTITPVLDLDSMMSNPSSILSAFNETVDVSDKFFGDNMMDNIASNISLEEAINGLSDKLDGFGDDITVHVPVNVNGKTIAEAITPDLDRSLGTRSFLSGRRLAGT